MIGALISGTLAADPVERTTRKGSPVSAAGALEQTAWTTQAGEARTGWRLTASEVLTAYSAAKKRREADDDA